MPKKRLAFAWLAVLLALVALANPVSADHSTYSGVTGATLIDSGFMVVEDEGAFARVEGFEYLRRQDGGVTLLNTITANDGSYRVRGRFDYDDNWRDTSAAGIGFYQGVAVEISLRKAAELVAISVKGDGIDLQPTASCEPDCFLNLSPSALAMFVMTRHYDQKAGGEQVFRWSGQDLDQLRTLSGGVARLRYRGLRKIPRASGESLSIRHYSFVETLPTPDGGWFSLDFDLWTDTDERPMGFRVMVPGGTPSGTIGFRQGFDDVKNTLLSSTPLPNSSTIAD